MKNFSRLRKGAEVTIGELSPLFVEQGIEGHSGLTIIASTQQDYGGMIGAPNQLNARAYFETDEDMSLETFRQQFTDGGWTDLTTSGLIAWGFVDANQERVTPLTSNYGNYCRQNATLYFNFYEGIVEVSLDVFDKATNVCEEQSQLGMQSIPPDLDIEVPELKLTPPTGTRSLYSEPLPYYPVAKSTIQNVELPGGWGSRATLSTTLSPMRVLADYNEQMRDVGWMMGRSNADELHDWSEWTFTDEAGQDWLATINVTHHEA